MNEELLAFIVGIVAMILVCLAFPSISLSMYCIGQFPISHEGPCKK